jgi:hypothetical protein
MAGIGRRPLLRRFVPSHFDDPFGTARRVLTSGGPGGRHAVMLAVLGLLASPVDRLLEPRERSRYAAADAPTLPILFICGPPRSGTTIVGLSLMRSLDVAYLTNLTSVFPLAPITASRILRTGPDQRWVSLESYYGRTSGFRAPNDGLYLWDRWLGADRTRVLDRLDPGAADAMVRFFGAHEAWAGRALVAKNNALNAHAHLIAALLPTARFLCLARDPLYLGQSLLIARREIHGSDTKVYGLAPPALDGPADLYRDIARQVAFHEGLARSQQRRLGEDRFRIVSYEDFCHAPGDFVARVAGDMGVTAGTEGLPARFEPSRARRLSDVEFEALGSAIAEREAA